MKALLSLGYAPNSCAECPLKRKKFAYKYYDMDIYEYRCAITNSFLYDNSLEDDKMLFSALHSKRSNDCELSILDDEDFNRIAKEIKANEKH